MPILKTFLAALMVIASAVNAAAQSFNFRQYQVENGLSNNATICILQDQKGFIWFGTKDGLNRFDGYTFKIFRTIAGDSTSIGSNFIHCLYEDKNGVLWVGTENGLFKYNAVLENFELLQGSIPGPIRDVALDTNGNLWFIIGFTLFELEKGKGIIAFDTRTYFEATSLCTLANGSVWIATPTGLLKKANSVNHLFTSFDVFAKSNPATTKWIEKLYVTSQGQIMIGTSNQGAKLFNPTTETYQDFLQYNQDKTEIFVRSFVQVADDEFWIGTESGIYIYNTKNGLATNLKKSFNDPYSLSDNAVYSFCKDREGGIWVGTYFGGINYYPKMHTAFNKLFPMVGQNSLSGNIVREIQQDKTGDIWIGTEDAGLNKYDTSTKKITAYTPTGLANSISYNNIHGLLADDDKIWIGTFEHGLDVMDRSSGKVIEHYSAGNGPNDLKSNFIFSIAKNARQQIMVATTRGAYIFNGQQKNFIPIVNLPINVWYTSLLMDKQGVIWGTTYGNGIIFTNTRNNNNGNYTFEATNKTSIASNRVNSMFEDVDGTLWFATEGGLCKLNRDKKGFTTYTTANGFPSNFILSILQDDKKILWVSTSKGLVAFNPATQQTKTYTSVNGLLNDQFNFNSAYKDASGTMYFGSVKGMVTFNPNHFLQDDYIPPVYITGFQVFNKELSIQQNGPLQQALINTRQITLNHDRSTISIDFASLSFTAPEMAEYSYKMDGLDKNWTLLKQNRKAYFTDLSPGTYVFRVKATNSSGLWNARETSLIIKILPPWWASNIAFVVYLLLFVALIYALINYYHNLVSAKNHRKFELLEIAKEKEVYEAKIDFFTNVAHEIKTPLTLIKAPLEKVIKKSESSPEVDNYLKIMERNTNRLIDLTNQLLDFSQTEIHGYSLHFNQTDITEMVDEAFASFTPLADEKNIHFHLQLPTPRVIAYVDQDALNKIVFNLLNNAIKYADKKIWVGLSANEGNNTFTLEVRNDGYIIPAEMSEKIFEPFFRLKQNEKQKGTGIGLALCMSLVTLHKGSLVLKPQSNGLNNFVLTLPLHQNAH